MALFPKAPHFDAVRRQMTRRVPCGLFGKGDRADGRVIALPGAIRAKKAIPAAYGNEKCSLFLCSALH